MAWKNFIDKAVARYRRNRRERRENLQSRNTNIHRTTDPSVAGPATRAEEASSSMRSFVPVPPQGRPPFGASEMSLAGVPREARPADSSVASLTPPPPPPPPSTNRSAARPSQAPQSAAASNSPRLAEPRPRQLRPWGRRRVPPIQLEIPPPLPTSRGGSERVAADTPPAITVSAVPDDSPVGAVSTRPVEGQGDGGDGVGDDDTENKGNLLARLYKRGSYASQSEGNLGIPPVCAEMGVVLERSHQKDRLMRRSALGRNESTGQNARPIEVAPSLQGAAEESNLPSNEEAKGTSSATGAQSRNSVYDSLNRSQCNNEAGVRNSMANPLLLKDENGRDLVSSPALERTGPAVSWSELSRLIQMEPDSPDSTDAPPPPLILGRYHEHESFAISDPDDDHDYDTDERKKRLKRFSQLMKQ